MREHAIVIGARGGGPVRRRATVALANPQGFAPSGARRISHWPRVQRVVPFVAALALGMILGIVGPSVAAAKGAKYYFQLHEVESRVPLDGQLRQFTGDAVKAELGARREWESDLGGVTDRDAVVAELKKRKLAGFDVVVKIATLKKEVKEPKPGSRLQRLSVAVKLSVLGTTLPGEKMAFGGDGEAGAETEVSERRMDAETESLIKDAIKDAIKQAVDQAVLKLGTPQSAPMNESKRNRKKP